MKRISRIYVWNSTANSSSYAVFEATKLNSVVNYPASDISPTRTNRVAFKHLNYMSKSRDASNRTAIFKRKCWRNVTCLWALVTRHPSYHRFVSIVTSLERKQFTIHYINSAFLHKYKNVIHFI